MSESSIFYDGLNKAIPAERCKLMTIADKENLNCKTVGIAIGNDFSHNEVIGIWAPKEHDPNHDSLVYRGEAWATPDEYLNLTINKYIGVIPDNRWNGGTINILVKEYSDNIVCNLPKKKHDTSNCADGGKNEC